MIVRIKFKSRVKSGRKTSSMYDYVDIHTTSVKDAKEIFDRWIHFGMGIRGSSGIYHALGDFGKIKMKSAKEKQ